MKKIISILLTLTLFTPCAFARGWVNISSWAYNDVSIFTNLGLMPESFNEVTDYTENITREQFAELLFTAANSKHSIIDMYYIGYESSERLKYRDYIEYLKLLEIMKGMPDGNFYPELPITREDAAVSIYRTINSFRFYFEPDYKYSDTDVFFEDESKISDYASDAVKSLCSLGIIKGDSEKLFNPKSHISTEEAIIMLNRMYSLWISPEMTDGYNIISGEEQLVKDYGNGFSEYKNPSRNQYIITDGQKRLEFATDIYSNILCVTLPDKTTYIGAITYNNTSNVFDVYGKLIFSLPYKLHSLSDDCIYTEKDNTYGMYSYSGNEIILPLYSLYELGVIKENGFKIPNSEYSAPDGIVYFIDDESGKLYSVDSAGENKTLISDKKCSNISYYKGVLYYTSESGLTGRSVDGSEIIITDKNAVICSNGNTPIFTDNNFSYEEGYKFPSMGEKMFYVELTGENAGNLYSFTIDGNDVTSKLIDTNVFIKINSPASPHIYKNCLYYSVTDENEKKFLMRLQSDFTKEKISDTHSIMQYGFCGDELIINTKKDVYYKTKLDTINFEKFEPEKSEKSNTAKNNIIKRISGLYHMSDSGAEQLISEFPHTYHYVNDYLYYTENTDDMYLQNLYMYNLNTGKRKLLTTTAINGFIYSEGSENVIFESLNSQLCRIDGETISQVYPNGGLCRYDKPVFFRRIGNDLVKIGKNGSCTLIADSVSYYGWIYVENGSEAVSASRNF